jgi:hypothetical protein
MMHSLLKHQSIITSYITVQSIFDKTIQPMHYYPLQIAKFVRIWLCSIIVCWLLSTTIFILVFTFHPILINLTLPYMNREGQLQNR